MVQLILTVMMVLSGALAHATTYYVATTGSDSNNGTSEETPFLTVAKCVDTMVAGDTCYVRGGTYNSGHVRFRRSGTAQAPIKLLNYPGESPIIDFNRTPSNVTSQYEILVQSGANTPIGWITIEGFEIKRGWKGVKWHNLHDSVIRRNWMHDALRGSSLQGIGGTRVLVDRNIINGNAVLDASGTGTGGHGLYLHGSHYTFTNNLIYDNYTFGLQINGSSTAVYNSAIHPSPEFATAANWIVANNTFAYSRHGSGIVVWGSLCNNLRIENNIFYENNVSARNAGQGIEFLGSSGITGAQIRNNLFYASGSGGTAQYFGTQPGTLVSTGNVVNVSSPAFVNGGSNAFPGLPDFSLTSTSPAIGMARANEFPRNATLTVGAFDTVGTPIGSITTNTATLIFPMSSAVPIQNLSTVGATVGCTGTACPGSPTVSAVSRVTATDSHVGITISGITGNACEAANQNWTQSYNGATGSWSGNDHIGPYPGLHQKIFSFTSLALTNQCTGSAPLPAPGTPHIYYKFEDGSGTNVNDSSSNNLDCTFTNTPTWGGGKTGGGMVVAAASTQHCAIPWGSGVNPYSTDLTIVHPVLIAVGTENATHYVAGPSHGTNQRFYVCGLNGTWRIAYQAVTCSSTAASSLAVTSGWNFLVVRIDSATHTATLSKDGIAGTGGASVTLTSYTWASNWTLGRVGTLASSGGTYDDFLVYLSLQDPVALYEAFQGTATPAAGTLAQAAVQYQGVTLDVTGNVITFGALNSTQEVVTRGGAAVVFQIHCQAGAACDETAFKLVYARNQTAAAARAAGTYVAVPNTETSDGFWFWGTTPSVLNNGVTTTRLTGSCAVTNGATQLTADQVPSVALPSDGCVMLRYIFRVGDGVGDYFEPFLVTQSGLLLPGGYVDGRVNVVNPRASGIGF